ncbi:MAG: hypothetical protein JST82_01445 [Bacteroidetes bacterium]|nr:hypothetical protein [Bacteroidota bacterium]
MKTIFILLLPALLITKTYAQDDTIVSRFANHDKLESQIKVNRNGKGNSAFTLSLAKLENIIKSGTTAKALENQLGVWQSFASDNTVGYDWNDKTKEYDVPRLQLQYSTEVKNRSYVIRAEVPKDLTNNIKYLEIITIMNGMQVAEFKQSLRNNGYLENENLTKTFRKQTWQNKTKHLTITIKENSNDTHTIGIR